jgi:hypothetical protein
MKLPKEKEDFPKLKKELEQKKNVIPLRYVCEDKAKQIEDDIEKEIKQAKKIKNEPDPYRYAGYSPTVVDFIRRCETSDQAIEIIDFLEKKGELDSLEASKLKDQLASNGLRSFGSKKESGFYFLQDEE